MPVALDVTVGGVSANSYCTLAEANTYHDGLTADLGAVWSAAASDDARNRALVTATRLLDEAFEWFGATVTATQRLLWPRCGMVDLGGNSIATTVIPEKLKQATAEFARQLLASDRISDSDLEVQGITHIKAGSVELNFQDPIVKTISDSVYRMVSQWGVLRDSHGVARVVRG